MLTLDPSAGIDVNRADEAMTCKLRAAGADDLTVRLCLGMSGLDRIIAANRGRRCHVVVSSFPKSGTTFLHRVLLNATGFTDYLLDRCSEDRQQTIVRQWIPMFLAQDTVSSLHMFADAPALRTIEELGVRPTVLVRDLFDTLVSVRDHLVKEDHVVPMAQAPASFDEWDERDQFWYIARMVAPWYLNFFASWQKAARQLDVLWVRYEDLVAHPVQTADRVLAHGGVCIDAGRIEQVVANIDLRTVRFNVGVTGRGRTVLSRAQRRCIAATAAAFQGQCDFSLIGL